MDLERPVENAPDVSAELTPIRQLPSEELLRGEREVHIIHKGSVYRLCITSRGRLILQK